jgi:hypothetical protein
MKRTPSPELDALLDAIGPDLGPVEDDHDVLAALAAGDAVQGRDPALWTPLDEAAVARLTRAAMSARDGAPSAEALALRPVAQAAADATRSRAGAVRGLWGWLTTPAFGVAFALAAAVLLWPSAPPSLPNYVLQAGAGDRAYRGAAAASESVATVSDGSVYRLVLRPETPVAGVGAGVFVRGDAGWRPLDAEVQVDESGAVRVDLRVDAALPVGDVLVAVVLKPGAAPSVEDVGKESTWEVALRHVVPGSGSASP